MSGRKEEIARLEALLEKLREEDLEESPAVDDPFKDPPLAKDAWEKAARRTLEDSDWDRLPEGKESEPYTLDDIEAAGLRLISTHRDSFIGKSGRDRLLLYLDSLDVARVAGFSDRKRNRRRK